MTAHPAFQFVAGDDWEIRATLLDENGVPYNLGSATVKWLMYGGGNSAGGGVQPVLDDGDYSLSIVDAAAGTCSIKVLSARSATIKGGQYRDTIRIVSGGVTSTLSMGVIYVTDNPWAVVAQPFKLTAVA